MVLAKDWNVSYEGNNRRSVYGRRFYVGLLHEGSYEHDDTYVHNTRYSMHDRGNGVGGTDAVRHEPFP